MENHGLHNAPHKTTQQQQQQQQHPHTSDDEHSDYYTLKTGKKRERATQACSPCRKKKKRCDGAKPNCRNCMDAGLECSYAATKRRGPRKGYVQLLEERLALLERRLTSIPNAKSPTSPLSPAKDYMVSQTNLAQGSLDDVKMPSEDVVLHLVDFFFKYINSIFPLVHHSTLVQSIKDGSISQPLLWSVMAIGARFSDHPEIKTDPPYWAGEKFARKAGSLINNDLFEPTVPNLQFWGVMACLEYGRAAGSRAWIYGGLAARICFELGFHREDTLKLPVYKKNGSMDHVAMLMRRRIFWSCFNIDKYGSAGNSRPQFFSKGDYDVDLPDEESLALLNPLHQNVTVDYKPVKVDSLGSFIKHYLSLMELFGDVIKGMQRAKVNQGKAIWPPMDDFDQLNNELQAWKQNLPPRFDFSLEDLDYHLERASRGKINHYLCAHVIWRTLVLALHRGSLAYIDKSGHSHFSPHTWERIQYSVAMCKQVVHDVMPVFEAMKNICGINVIPYMGYSSYMFATILMTSTFTNTEEEHRKGTKGLLLLYDMIELLRPYWPVCERLSITTRDLIVSHSKMYEYSQEEHYKRTGYEVPSSSSSSSSFQPYLPPSKPLKPTTNTIPVSMTDLLHADNTTPTTTPIYPYSLPSTLSTTPPNPQLPPSSSSTLLSNPMDFNLTDPIDFNSSAFLYDTGLFGQIMFDEAKFMTPTNNSNNNNNALLFGLQQPYSQPYNNTTTSPTAYSSSQQQQSPYNSTTSPTAYSSTQQQQRSYNSTTSPTAYSASQQQHQASTSPPQAPVISNYGKRTWDPVWRS